VEADLSRYYGASLADLWQGRLTLWQVWARIQHLPEESATARAVGTGDGWPLIGYLIADIYALLAEQPHPADPRKERRKELKAKRAAQAAADLKAYDAERAELRRQRAEQAEHTESQQYSA